jgi:predicted nucleic acid-binding protein
MRRVVSDTGPILHLYESQALNLLSLAGAVHIPTAVQAEIAYHISVWQPPAWLTVDTLVEPHATEAVNWRQAGLLHTGEAEAVALARQLKADWFLTDDAAARLLAQTLGLETHGSLGIVLWAAIAGHINQIEAETALNQLALSSLWVSARALAEARNALAQLFP